MINSIHQVRHVSFMAHHSDSHSVIKTHFYPVTITNFHCVDETLMRGGKPSQEQLKELQKCGVKNVISFCTNYNPATKTQGTMPDEAELAKKLGMKFFWLPFKSKDNPSDEAVNEFFKIIDNARANNEKVFIHCRHGADRTGLFSALYRIKYQKCKLSDVIRELMTYGHDANHNPNIIPFIIDFKESLNPINKFNKFKEIVYKLLIK